MYKPRARPPAGNALPPLKKIFATRPFSCICHRHVSTGETVYVDGLNRRLICLSCGTLSSKSKVVPITEADDWQRSYDRMRALENLPGPLKPHLQEELDFLISRCAQPKRSQVDLSIEKDRWLHGTYNKYAQPCIRCDAWQELGSYVAWHRARKFIICSKCLQS
jgi:hypothetical protein